MDRVNDTEDPRDVNEKLRREEGYAICVLSAENHWRQLRDRLGYDSMIKMLTAAHFAEEAAFNHDSDE